MTLTSNRRWQLSFGVCQGPGWVLRPFNDTLGHDKENTKGHGQSPASSSFDLTASYLAIASALTEKPQGAFKKKGTGGQYEALGGAATPRAGALLIAIKQLTSGPGGLGSLAVQAVLYELGAS